MGFYEVYKQATGNFKALHSEKKFNKSKEMSLLSEVTQNVSYEQPRSKYLNFIFGPKTR